MENLEIHAAGGIANTIYPTPKFTDFKDGCLSLDTLHTVAVTAKIIRCWNSL